MVMMVNSRMNRPLRTETVCIGVRTTLAVKRSEASRAADTFRRECAMGRLRAALDSRLSVRWVYNLLGRQNRTSEGQPW